MLASAAAKRELLASAGEGPRHAALDGIDGKIADLTAERTELRRRIEDRRDWLGTVIERGPAASTADQLRLEPAKAELAAMLLEDAAIGARFDGLLIEQATAMAALLRAEAI